MNPLAKIVLTMAVLGLTVPVTQRAFGQTDSMDYWQRHWARYDEGTRPSSTWHSSHFTRLGGGSYHYDRDLRRYNSAAFGGRSYLYDRDLGNASMRPHQGTSYHAQRSFYRARPRASWNSQRTSRTTPWLPLGIR